jgi:hypothetical protein
MTVADTAAGHPGHVPAQIDLQLRQACADGGNLQTNLTGQVLISAIAVLACFERATIQAILK